MWDLGYGKSISDQLISKLHDSLVLYSQKNNIDDFQKGKELMHNDHA